LRKQLVIYLMAGPRTPSLAEAAVQGGADIIELGFPFSDPLAEGPVIREASEQALAAGMRTAACLQSLADTRERIGAKTPIIPMTYAALLEAYGYQRFVHDARAAGATSFILVDLPSEHHQEIRRVHLIAPTSTDERIRLAAGQTDGWLYVVSLTGTTGARPDVSDELPGLVNRTRTIVDGVPLFAGFGIGTPEQAHHAAAHCDGVVVGSRAVQVGQNGPAALRDFVGGLRVAIDAASP
jgi:tryptophan synthase alpha subunit